jgi:hypothetical protein
MTQQQIGKKLEAGILNKAKFKTILAGIFKNKSTQVESMTKDTKIAKQIAEKNQFFKI